MVPLPPRGLPVKGSATREARGDDPLPALREDLVHLAGRLISEVRSPFAQSGRDDPGEAEEMCCARVRCELPLQPVRAGPHAVARCRLARGEECGVLDERGVGLPGALRGCPQALRVPTRDGLREPRRQELMSPDTRLNAPQRIVEEAQGEPVLDGGVPEVDVQMVARAVLLDERAGPPLRLGICPSSCLLDVRCCWGSLRHGLAPFAPRGKVRAGGTRERSRFGAVISHAARRPGGMIRLPSSPARTDRAASAGPSPERSPPGTRRRRTRA